MSKNKRLKHNATRLLFFITTVFSTASFAAEKLVFTSVNGSYIQEISESVLKVAYAKIGIDFETSWLPPKRALLIANAGQSDGEISRLNSVARNYSNLIQVKIPVNIVEGMAITKNKSLPINNWDDLRAFRIGVNRGVIFAEKGTEGMNVLLVNSFPSLFQVLDKDRVDVIISPRIIGLYQIIKLNLKDLIINEPPLTKFNMYHYLHKRHHELATRLEVTLKKMEESGEIHRIRAASIQDLKQGIIPDKN